MNNVLKYYGVKEGEFIVPLPGQNLDQILKDIRIEIKYIQEPVDLTQCFYEVFINLSEENVEKINALSTDKILPEALKAAKDHNEYVLGELSQVVKEANCFSSLDDKMLLQEVIDRILHYKDDFRTALNALLRVYKLETEMIDTVDALGTPITVRKIKTI